MEGEGWMYKCFHPPDKTSCACDHCHPLPFPTIQTQAMHNCNPPSSLRRPTAFTTFDMDIGYDSATPPPPFRPLGSERQVKEDDCRGKREDKVGDVTLQNRFGYDAREKREERGGRKGRKGVAEKGSGKE